MISMPEADAGRFQEAFGLRTSTEYSSRGASNPEAVARRRGAVSIGIPAGACRLIAIRHTQLTQGQTVP